MNLAELENGKKIKNDPIVSGVYALFKDKEIVYVGQSTNIHTRIRMHLSDKDFDSFTYIAAPKEKLTDMEVDLIVKHRPKYNKSLPLESRFINLSKLKNLYSEAFAKIGNNEYVDPKKLKEMLHDEYCFHTGNIQKIEKV